MSDETHEVPIEETATPKPRKPDVAELRERFGIDEQGNAIEPRPKTDPPPLVDRKEQT